MQQVYRRPTKTIRRGWRLAQRDDDVGGHWFEGRNMSTCRLYIFRR
jgi:hypothetical protein